MDRRLFVAAGLAFASALPARAQTTPAAAPSATTPSATAPSTAAAAPAEVMGLGDAEKQHIMRTMMVGTLSLEMSKIAVQRVQNAKLKEFANFEVAEQETVADVLKAIKAAANDMTPPPEMDAAHAAMLQKLQAAKGAAFDRAYIEGQIDGHQQLLKIQEDYLAVGKNLGNTNVAKLARGVIKEHLTLLSDLQKERA